jgi:hypothetical protein
VTTRVAAKSSASRQLCRHTSALTPTRSPSHVAGVVTATRIARTYPNIAKQYTKMTRLLSLAHIQAASTETHAPNVSSDIAARPATEWLYTVTHTNGPNTREKSKCGAAQQVSLPAWFRISSGENKKHLTSHDHQKSFIFCFFCCFVDKIHLSVCII